MKKILLFVVIFFVACCVEAGENTKSPAVVGKCKTDAMVAASIFMFTVTNACVEASKNKSSDLCHDYDIKEISKAVYKLMSVVYRKCIDENNEA